jgi:hypothetical protein
MWILTSQLTTIQLSPFMRKHLKMVIGSVVPSQYVFEM